MRQRSAGEAADDAVGPRGSSGPDGGGRGPALGLRARIGGGGDAVPRGHVAAARWSAAVGGRVRPDSDTSGGEGSRFLGF